MSNEQNTPKSSPSDQPSMVNGRKPQPSDELSKEDLDRATGGLLPAVGPEK